VLPSGRTVDVNRTQRAASRPQHGELERGGRGAQQRQLGPAASRSAPPVVRPIAIPAANAVITHVKASVRACAGTSSSNRPKIVVIGPKAGPAGEQGTASIAATGGRRAPSSAMSASDRRP
jgi:hypothetical protein